MPKSVRKAKSPQRISHHVQKATYEQRLAGLFSGGGTGTKKKGSKKKSSWLSYPVKKDMILFQTLNDIHAIFASTQKN